MAKEPEKQKRRVVRIPVENTAIPSGRRFFVFEDDRIMQVVVACQGDHDAWRQRLLRSRPPLVDRTVVCEEPEQILVATSFIGPDDEPPDSEPTPYATLIWGGPLRWHCWHYATLGEAKSGHWKVVDRVRKALTKAE